MIIRFIVFSFLMLQIFSCRAQNKFVENSDEINDTEINTNPKLVVGIIIDQMRYDYLTRFYKRYGEGGFKRMVKEGFNCKNNHFDYIPTKTAAGHASVFTGTTPKYHGIIGNDWFDKDVNKKVNSVADSSYIPIGTDTVAKGASPHRLLVTTFSDENRLFTQMRGKTIGISLKDRAVVLASGHTANAAYWMNYKGDGNWVTSSFYMKELPKWVNDFNASDITESYFKVWNTLYGIDTYIDSGPDLNTFERIFIGKETATFPYDLNALKSQNGNFKIIAESPFGNKLTTDFALAAIDGEQLGQDNITDVLTISYSSTDKVGHDFGVNAIETEDTYLRMDLELERLFNALDEKVGKGEYTVFLTADHGAQYTPAFLQSKKIPAGLFDLRKLKNELNTLLYNRYKISNLILSNMLNQIFLDHKKIEENKLDLKKLKNVISLELLKYQLIDKVYVTSEINQFEGSNGYLENLLSNGHHQKRSGDILFVFNPSVFKDAPWNRTGTDHHSGLDYDTHVPLLFFGKGIVHGSTLQKTLAIDIAPTMSALLGISFPNAATGQPLEFVLE